VTKPCVKVLACATVVEEMRNRLPDGVVCETLDFGLHIKPESLKAALQDAIDASASGGFDVIVLGYGLCSMAVVGLSSEFSTLVVPRVDDCIAIFLGSRQAYRDQASHAPGTYYLTKGWIEVGDTPFKGYDRLIEKYGAERAKRVMSLMLRHYTRLALINTGEDNMERYRDEARQIAARFDLAYEEIPGSKNLVDKIVNGPWDDEFIVIPPGRPIAYSDFT
jgi:Protein of unknown function (DUF1638)